MRRQGTQTTNLIEDKYIPGPLFTMKQYQKEHAAIETVPLENGGLADKLVLVVDKGYLTLLMKALKAYRTNAADHLYEMLEQAQSQQFFDDEG